MKRVMLLLIVSMLYVGNAVTAEYYDKNPDHCPSIGISYNTLSLDNDYTVKSGIVSATTSGDSSFDTIAFDGRLPVSESITLYGAVGVISGDAKITESNMLNGQDVDTKGKSLSVGVRFYIN